MPGRAAPDFDALAACLGHHFTTPALLNEALRHPSAASGRKSSYQRLEFLGDRVLGLIVAELLFRRFPDEPEGALAKRLAALVRQETLTQVSAGLGLSRHVVLAKAEDEAGERDNPALMADVCESLIGALFLDGGLAASRRFVEAHWTPLLEAEPIPPQDAKTALQEWAQARGLPLPDYRELARDGPAHDPRFTVEVAVVDQPPESGEGRSKRLAEQAAAARLLARLTGA